MAAVSSQTESASRQETEGEIVVHICGEVNAPGLYRAPAGSRVGELLALAGGATEKGEPDRLNLAAEAKDGERIYVPAIGESISPYEGEQEDGKVNLNTADASRLQELPGIGEAKAEAIIRYREEHGPFSSVEDLKNVPGIKDGVFSSLEPYIYVN